MTKRPRVASFISCDPSSIHTTVAVGDSITQGGPALLGGYRAPLFRANPGLKFLGREYFVGYNEGYGGYRIDEIAAVVLPYLPSIAPDAVLLLAGTNNIFQGQSAATAFALYQQFAIDLKAIVGVNHVLVATIPEVSTAPAVRAAYNALVMGWSPPAGITVHDISGTLIYPTDYADGLHPNQAGYDKMAIEWDTAVQAVVF